MVVILQEKEMISLVADKISDCKKLERINLVQLIRSISKTLEQI